MATQTLRKMVQGEAYQIVLLQLMGVVMLAVLSLVLNGTRSGFSVLMGGLAYGLPNLIFVWRVFRYVGASQITQFVTAFFIGEIVKLILSAVLFLMIVKYLPISLLSVLIGFAGAIVLFWVVCFWIFSKKKTSCKET
ncbi:MAG: ATP synthase subunit I [Gammaproteobacteria bacterium]|nr:ATP synthase subunit I [Gammaproteobacteria bacterium]MCW5583634.1 ATP synthase subunit I [Gammaproteobacteria bacterium]